MDKDKYEYEAKYNFKYKDEYKDKYNYKQVQFPPLM